jgi:hypothetical protein
VPDWKDKNSYPVPFSESDNSDWQQWRWEFLRRDEEYRNDWLRIRAIDPDGKLALAANSSQYLDWTVPILVKEQYADPFYFQKKYKVKKLFNPAEKSPHQLAFYPFPSNSVTMLFDLDKPLSEQIDRAVSILRKYQKSIRGIILRDRDPGEKSKWPCYLQAIDAQDQGIVLSEIGYEILGLDRKAYGRLEAKKAASDFLAIVRTFWKKRPLPSIKS